jgi:long-chain acyl-CoA synthetase
VSAHASPLSASASIPELLARLAGAHPERVASHHRAGAGGWVPTRLAELHAEVRRIADGLRQVGLERGDRLAILSPTRREWQVAEIAGLAAGAVVVGIDAHAPAHQAAWVLGHAGATGLVVDSPERLATLPALTVKRLRAVVVLPGPSAEARPSGTVGWDELLAAGLGGSGTDAWLPSEDDPATLIYTSGTTGTPRGIPYAHRHLLAACRAIIAEFRGLDEPGHSVACWLPMAPLFQRMMNLVALAAGIPTYFVEDPREILGALREIRPTLFVGVPHFYEKLEGGIRQHVAAQPPWRRRLVDAAQRVGAEVARRTREGEPLSPWLRLRHRVADRLVLRRIRDVMGGRIRWMISGSAPAPRWLLESLHAVGLLVLEAYGLTESTVPIAANRPDSYRFGSVGKAFAMNEIRLAEDGELLVRGPGVFGGYEGDRPGPPAGAFTDGGYYRTGDCARLDEDGFLFLVGRKTEIIKTSTGRRVSPAQVEAVYRQSPLVDEIVVVGDARKHLAALVTLDVAAVEGELRRAGIAAPSRGDLAARADVKALVARSLQACDAQLPGPDRIRAFAILPEPLSMADEELTTSLKLRRQRIEARHAPLIDALYANRQG